MRNLICSESDFPLVFDTSNRYHALSKYRLDTYSHHDILFSFKKQTLFRIVGLQH